jgi:hypothetical protein
MELSKAGIVMYLIIGACLGVIVLVFYVWNTFGTWTLLEAKTGSEVLTHTSLCFSVL